MVRSDRRKFLEASAAAGAMALGHVALGSEAKHPPKLRVGVIGVGWYGVVDAEAALKIGGVEIVAICDVDRDHLTQAADKLEKLQGQRPKTFTDYQALLDSKLLDAVILGTPPHWHALQLLAALQCGLDIYCEKPISYTIREGQAMVEAVRRSQQIVQVGFQRRQSAALQQAVDLIHQGGIGELVQVDAQIHYHAGLVDNTPQDPPTTLDWNSWCGPGPMIPYSPQVGHKHWRLEKTSGHGHLVDWGIHLIDAIRTFLELPMPKSVTAAGDLCQYASRITTPDTLSVHFEFDKVPVHWRHRLWGATEYDPEVSNGIFFFGTKGTIFATDQKWVLIRPGKNGGREEHKVPKNLGLLHMADFLDAVRTRRQPACPIADAFQSTATVQLAMIAYETGSTVHWDESKGEIVNNPPAAALLRRDYREPWVHP